MSDHEANEDDMPDDKDSTHSGEGNGEGESEGDVVVADVVVVDVDRDGDGETHGEDEEDSSDVFFDAGEGVVISGDRLSLHAVTQPQRAAKVAAAAAPKTIPSIPYHPALPSHITPHPAAANRPQWTFHHAQSRQLQRILTTKSR